MLKASLAAIAALAVTASAAASQSGGGAPPALASGVYDNTLLLAVGPDGRVSGYFDMSQPGPRSSAASSI